MLKNKNKKTKRKIGRKLIKIELLRSTLVRFVLAISADGATKHAAESTAGELWWGWISPARRRRRRRWYCVHFICGRRSVSFKCRGTAGSDASRRPQLTGKKNNVVLVFMEALRGRFQFAAQESVVPHQAGGTLSPERHGGPLQLRHVDSKIVDPITRSNNARIWYFLPFFCYVFYVLSFWCWFFVLVYKI